MRSHQTTELTWYALTQTPPLQQVVNPEDALPPPYTAGDFTSLMQAPRYSEVSRVLFILKWFFGVQFVVSFLYPCMIWRAQSKPSCLFSPLHCFRGIQIVRALNALLTLVGSYICQWNQSSQLLANPDHSIFSLFQVVNTCYLGRRSFFHRNSAFACMGSVRTLAIGQLDIY
jgi:hypothetical protein